MKTVLDASILPSNLTIKNKLGRDIEIPIYPDAGSLMIKSGEKIIYQVKESREFLYYYNVCKELNLELEAELITQPIGVELITAEVDLDLSGGVQEITPEFVGQAFDKIIINAPSNLTPENIKKGVSIAGIEGEYEDENKNPRDLYRYLKYDEHPDGGLTISVDDEEVDKAENNSEIQGEAILFIPKEHNGKRVSHIGNMDRLAPYVATLLIEPDDINEDPNHLIHNMRRYIDDSSFEGFHFLTEVVIPNGVVVGYNSFSQCYNIRSFSFDTLVQNSYGGVGRFRDMVESHASMSVIMRVGGILDHDYFFENCYSLRSVSIMKDDRVGWYSNRVPSYYCQGCHELVSFEFPRDEWGEIANLEYIGVAAFSNTRLRSIEVMVNRVEDLAFSSNNELTSVVIRGGWQTTLFNGCFSDCPNLRSVKIESNEVFIEGHVFENCPNLSLIEVKSFDDIIDPNNRSRLYIRGDMFGTWYYGSGSPLKLNADIVEITNCQFFPEQRITEFRIHRECYGNLYGFDLSTMTSLYMVTVDSPNILDNINYEGDLGGLFSHCKLIYLKRDDYGLGDGPSIGTYIVDNFTEVAWIPNDMYGEHEGYVLYLRNNG